MRPFHLYAAKKNSAGQSLPLKSVIDHELGHILFVEEHYQEPSGACGSGHASVMDAFSGTAPCDSGTPTGDDEVDFDQGYRPRDDTGAEAMSINSSTKVTHSWDNTEPHRHNLAQ